MAAFLSFGEKWIPIWRSSISPYVYKYPIGVCHSSPTMTLSCSCNSYKFWLPNAYFVTFPYKIFTHSLPHSTLWSTRPFWPSSGMNQLSYISSKLLFLTFDLKKEALSLFREKIVDVDDVSVERESFSIKFLIHWVIRRHLVLALMDFFPFQCSFLWEDIHNDK